MLGLGWPEILLILGVMVIIFGPKRIPELGGALGKTLRGFKEEIAANPDESKSGDDDVVEAEVRDFSENNPGR